VKERQGAALLRREGGEKVESEECRRSHQLGQCRDFSPRGAQVSGGMGGGRAHIIVAA
jgi:hypothetical protein